MLQLTQVPSTPIANPMRVPSVSVLAVTLLLTGCADHSVAKNTIPSISLKSNSLEHDNLVASVSTGKRLLRSSAGNETIWSKVIDSVAKDTSAHVRSHLEVAKQYSINDAFSYLNSQGLNPNALRREFRIDELLRSGTNISKNPKYVFYEEYSKYFEKNGGTI
ncbi:hypothetical protein PsorP6_011967 [Peronosclerospora sorghi]|uniref:Uncharacterized protein n=1 Tax=Peronosclerospora sorghi TaxID=230839 RepID=A0ACC0WIK8_9STRA|nr:hypothetical protein PsorP6_011967 [Peronosclerospora sorghi]